MLRYRILFFRQMDRTQCTSGVPYFFSFLISRLSFWYSVKGKEMVTLWFKSSLCFSTFSDFWQLFLSLPAFLFLTFSLSMSDHVIHARLHVVWTRTKGIQSQWTLNETSVKLQQNRKTRAAVCGQGCSCCDVNLCPENVWAEPADNKQRWKTHCVLICSNITLHTWPRAELEQWRCLKGGYTCWITLPETTSPPLSFMSYSIYVTVISLCIMN